jgi:hypothetical protein
MFRFSNPVSVRSADSICGTADHSAHRRGLRRDIQPGHPGLARGRRQQGDEHLDRGGLAGPVRTQEAENLAGADRYREVVHGHQGIEPAGEPFGL